MECKCCRICLFLVLRLRCGTVEVMMLDEVERTEVRDGDVSPLLS